MKSILKYILEKEEDISIVRNLEVVYAVKPEKFTIEVPNNYSESDMQIYLDDKTLNELPVSSDESKKMLDDNIKEISDAYFEYSGYNSSDKPTNEISLEWDDNYDNNSNDNEKIYFTLKYLKYKIMFNSFKLSNVDEDIQEQLENIFKSLESNSNNKYPITIEFESVSFEE